MYSMDNVGRNTIAMVLAGGKGERLSPLTLRRAKPSVAFGGKYKIIDFVLSNLFNSGIKKVYILTQYRAYSLNKHIRESWGKWTGLGEFYVAISPETSSESEEWFKGTADAILQYLRFVESSDADYVAVFGGDHIYKMDVTQMINFHRMNRADILSPPVIDLILLSAHLRPSSVSIAVTRRAPRKPAISVGCRSVVDAVNVSIGAVL